MTFRAVWALCATCVVAWSPAVVAQGQKAGPLTLPQALQRAANANPRIAAADRTIGMADGRREQANALPNPTLGVEVDNFAPGQSGAVQGAETTLQLSQLIELGGKRDARVKAVPDVTASVAWRYYGQTGDNALRLGASMPIPVLDRNRGGIREAQEAAQKTDAERARTGSP